MKIQITKEIKFNNDKIPNIKKGEILNLPYKKLTDEYCLIMEYQDRSFFFDKYISLYYTIGKNTLGIPLEENKHYKIICKERGKISNLTQTSFMLDEEIQTSLF
jgi:hypothetical protein